MFVQGKNDKIDMPIILVIDIKCIKIVSMKK